ncbi:MAG TPA: hypothetical protein VF147_03595 [Vicinamibacterales bacterium]
MNTPESCARKLSPLRATGIGRPVSTLCQSPTSDDAEPEKLSRLNRRAKSLLPDPGRDRERLRTQCVVDAQASEGDFTAARASLRETANVRRCSICAVGIGTFATKVTSARTDRGSAGNFVVDKV